MKTTFFSRNLWFLVSCQIYWHKFVLVLSYLYNHCSIYHYVPFTSQTLFICAFLCLSSLRSSLSTLLIFFKEQALVVFLSISSLFCISWLLPLLSFPLPFLGSSMLLSFSWTFGLLIFSPSFLVQGLMIIYLPQDLLLLLPQVLIFNTSIISSALCAFLISIPWFMIHVEMGYFSNYIEIIF